MTEVVLFEDDPAHIRLVDQTLRLAGHTLSSTYETLPAALLAIDTRSIDAAVRLAIVDGDLGSHQGNLDGRKIVSHLKDSYPQVDTIGNTQINSGVPGAKYQAGKNMTTLLNLLEHL